MEIHQGPDGKFLCVTQSGSNYEVEGGVLTIPSMDAEPPAPITPEQPPPTPEEIDAVFGMEPSAPTFLERMRRLFRGSQR